MDDRPDESGLRARLATGPPLLLDGATGTELERRGQPTGLPLWSTHALLDAPDVLTQIHADHARAGAEIITAATFRTQERTLARATPGSRALGDRSAELCAEAIALARRGAEAADHCVWVAGSAPPLEDCYRPDLTPSEPELTREHALHAQNLCLAGAELILVETMNSIREAFAAARAASQTGLPFVVSFVCWDRSKLLSGESLAAAIERISLLAPLLVAVNCLPPSSVDACLPVLRACGLPFGVYANLGEQGDETGFMRSEPCSPNELARHARSWVSGGARLVGGCCGTTPEHTRLIADTLLS